ncbi:MAG: hypothetical protein ABIG39_06975 [Candidatus Micrarchaeota archaeon]
MSTVDDAIFEIKLVLDRAMRQLFGAKDEESNKVKYCRACGTQNKEKAEKCVKCYRSFKVYER